MNTTATTLPARQEPTPETAPVLRLIVTCEDRAGIVSAIAGFLAGAGANIITSDQFSTDGGSGQFFLRMQFEQPAGSDRGELEARFGEEIGDRFGMEWRMWEAERPKRVAILVSRYDHCLLDLLWRWRRGELEAEIGLVASNHPDLREAVESFGLPYHHIPVAKDRKPEAETALLDVLRDDFDLIVLARYMQIVSGDFLERVGAPVINIHHSFLPAFAGAGPYERAKERGVKLIGATAHYVTEELDAGPIIEQDVIRVDHADSAEELERLGADIERSVLARAVKWHCEDRVLRDGNTTVVF
ncbi:MAG: formyltetrahydrofolate deformylase [Actinobacteria bacterium]|nr:formyltetrahydrofolate deformylase [Actinomycetota bacterium]